MASLMEAFLAQDAARSGEMNALLAGMTGTGGAFRDLPRSVIDPKTGKRQAYKAATGDVVTRAKLLPAGVTDNGRLVPALPEMITNALPGVNYVGDVVTGRKPGYYPGMGGPNDEQLEWAEGVAGGIYGAGLTGGAKVLPGEAILGSGPVRRSMAKNLGMGRDSLKSSADDLTWRTDLSTTKMARPLEEMSADRVPTGELAPRKFISPEALEGSLIVPAIGDRTAAGQILRGVNGQRLAHDVRLEGGPDYMRSAAAQGPDSSIWASGNSVISTIANRARKVQEENPGKDVNLAYTTMGGRSGDYSHMTADTLLGMLPGAKVSKGAMQELDDAIRAKSPAWVGLKSPEARQHLFDDPKSRTALVSEMDSAARRKQGFPDVTSARYAITEPELLNVPTGTSGYAIGRVAPGAPRTSNPAIPHTTYPDQMGGEYVGGFERGIPRELMFPDFYKRMDEVGMEPKYRDYTFSRQNIVQPANAEWLENIMRYIEASKAGR